MSGYFNLDVTPQGATTLRHQLNARYKGSEAFAIKAPDAAGTLIVHARSKEEAHHHLMNALFDLIFNRKRVGAVIENPACIYCDGPTESRGRNSSGTRCWRCLNPECRRSFVPNRTFRGGINHPSQSKKPAFYKLVFEEGVPIKEACDRLGISHGAGDNWFVKMQTINGREPLPCPCGKPMRHRGSCSYRQQYGRTVKERMRAGAA